MHSKIAITASALVLFACHAQSQSTTFTYQGRLNTTNGPANGLYDLRFTLYDALSAGSTVGGPLTNNAVTVTNGLFTTQIDFGLAAFPGTPRWLEIGVKTNGPSLSFAVMNPRQVLNSTPFAIRAAGVADGAITASKLSSGLGANGQVLKMNGSVLAWGTDLNAGGTVSSIATGPGLTGGPITTTGTLGLDTTIVPRLASANVFSASNNFSGPLTAAGPNNMFVGTFFGNGAGLTNVAGTSTNTGTLAGDVTGPVGNTTVAKIRNVNVLPIAPAAGQLLRFTGADWGPNLVQLGTDVAGTLADARLSANVPLLNGNQTFSSSNTFNGVALFNNSSSKFVGSFFGNGAGLSNIVTTTTNFSGSLAGDVIGTQNATTVARIRNLNILTTAPASGQLLRFNGTDWGPNFVQLGTDVAGTLADARLSANVSLLNGNQTFSGSNIFNGASTFNSSSNKFVGTFFGNGAGLTNISGTTSNFSGSLAGDVIGTQNATTVARIRNFNVLTTAPASGQLLRFNGTDWGPNFVQLGTDVAGTLADARLSANVPLLNGNQTFSSSNTFNGVALFNNSSSKFVGSFFGNGAGLSNIVSTTTNFSGVLGVTNGAVGLSSYAVGDLLYASAPTTLARLADITAGNALLSGGTGFAPFWGKIGLTTHVTGILPVANGGTGASTTSGLRTAIGAAASGANSDITSLTGLTTPLAPNQGGSGLAAYAAGDLLYAPAANTLARRAAGSEGQVLTVSAGIPTWLTANNHNHFAQAWNGIATDGLLVQNNNSVDGSSALTGTSSSSSGLGYGVFGQALSTSGVGVQGSAFATSGNCIGVSGESTSPTGNGVYGLASAGNGANVGVYGETLSTNGIGVYGVASLSTGVPVGVYGESFSPTGYGLYTPDRLYVGSTAFIGGHLSLQPAARLFADTGSAALPSISFNANPTSGIFSPATNQLALVTSGAQRLFVAADGKVGMGRVPTANLLEIAGEASKATAGSWLANSDARIKTNIRPLTNALDTIQRVHPVSFHYTDEYRHTHPGVENKQYHNVIAQEFADVFPESVKSSGEDLEGKPILQVDTYPATIYSIAAIQELRKLVEDKDAELARLKQQNDQLAERLSRLESKLK